MLNWRSHKPHAIGPAQLPGHAGLHSISEQTPNDSRHTLFWRQLISCGKRFATAFNTRQAQHISGIQCVVWHVPACALALPEYHVAAGGFMRVDPSGAGAPSAAKKPL